MKTHFLPCLASLAVISTAAAQMPTDGPTLFTINCSACHQLDTGVVGPSLVEIRSLYNDKPDDFVKWAIAPGKKRAGAIEMPSMVHLGEPALREIYQHVMTVSKGVKAKAEVKTDPFIASPTQTVRPVMQRIFLPNSGPANIAIALDDQTSLAWDAGECRLRYAWTGGFIDGYPYWKGNGSSQAKIIGKVRYTEAEPLLKGDVKFHGYQVKNGLPTFSYTAGSQEVSETFTAISGGKGFTRSISFSSPPSAPLVLTFPENQPVKTTCDVGTWNKNILTLTPSQAAKFTLTHTFQ
jgi:cytochrome c551/c552